jgi:hypothetical protein
MDSRKPGSRINVGTVRPLSYLENLNVADAGLEELQEDWGLLDDIDIDDEMDNEEVEGLQEDWGLLDSFDDGFDDDFDDSFDDSNDDDDGLGEL